MSAKASRDQDLRRELEEQRQRTETLSRLAMVTRLESSAEVWTETRSSNGCSGRAVN